MLAFAPTVAHAAQGSGAEHVLFSDSVASPEGATGTDAEGVLSSRYAAEDGPALLAAFLADPASAADIESEVRQTVTGQPVTVELLDGERLTLEPVDVAVHASRLDDDDPLTEDPLQPQIEWIGEKRTDDGVLATGTFTLVGDEAGDFVAHGSVSDGTRAFSVAPAGTGIYQVAELDPSYSPGPHGDAPNAPEETAGPTDGLPIVDDVGGLQDSAAAVSQNIDVLVAHTANTPAAAVQSIPQRIAETNAAFTNSGMSQRITLVATVSVSYTQHSSDMGVDLDRLRITNDTFLDNLHSLRDQYAADLVALIVPSATNACGIAYIPNTAGSEAWAFSVTAASCFTPDYTFTHELGHNLGGDHNPEDASGACNPYSYSCGHRVQGIARTVMSYNYSGCLCSAQPQYSNPSIDFVGHPGVRSGVANQSDNARSLTTLAPIVADYRNHQWSNWTNLGGTLAWGTSAVSPASSRLDVFTIAGTSANRLFQKTWSGTWGAWTDLGQPTGVALSGTPGSVTWQGGRIDVFARGSSGALWQRYHNGVSWSAWTNLGGTVGEGASAVSPSANRIDVFVIAGSSGDHLFQKTWSGTWGAWVDLGRPAAAGLTKAPGAVVWQTGRMDVFARGTDGALWQKYWNGSAWSGWTSLGGTLATGPSAISVRPNRLDVFTVAGSSGDHLFRKSFEGTWSSWIDVGRPTSTGLNAQPGAVTWLNGRADVFPRGNDGALWQRYHTGL